MRNSGVWIILEDRDVLEISLDCANLVTVYKHWIEDKQRSFLCKGEGCSWCLQKFPARIRHQAKVIIEGESLMWEFGEEVYSALAKLRNVEGWKKFTITHLGYGRKARDIITVEAPRQKKYNKYTSGKYGHLVNT